MATGEPITLIITPEPQPGNGQPGDAYWIYLCHMLDK